MDIFEELHSEHGKASDLLSKLKASGRDEGTSGKLKTELTAHAKAEEKVFYGRPRR